MSRWLREGLTEPKHVCLTPEDGEPWSVWECDCGRAYRFSCNRGYGFEWCRVIVRKPYYRLRHWLSKEGN
jgi:hypothetical protein